MNQYTVNVVLLAQFCRLLDSRSHNLISAVVQFREESHIILQAILDIIVAVLVHLFCSPVSRRPLYGFPQSPDMNCRDVTNQSCNSLSMKTNNGSRHRPVSYIGRRVVPVVISLAVIELVCRFHPASPATEFLNYYQLFVVQCSSRPYWHLITVFIA